MKLCILGASGGVGQHLVSQAVERGHDVTALVREGTPYEGPPQAKIVRGSVLSPEIYAQILPGCEAVLSSIGIKRRNLNPWSALTSPPDLCSSYARILVEAMRTHEVARVIAVSAAGVAESEPQMTWPMRFVVAWSNVGVAYRDLAVMESIYAGSGLDWCCVRPVALTDGPVTGKAHVVDHFGFSMRISRADVAHWMLQQLTEQITERLPQISN
jgi:putative NADH-flavin reductase